MIESLFLLPMTSIFLSRHQGLAFLSCCFPFRTAPDTVGSLCPLSPGLICCADSFQLHLLRSCSQPLLSQPKHHIFPVIFVGFRSDCVPLKILLISPFCIYAEPFPFPFPPASAHSAPCDETVCCCLSTLLFWLSIFFLHQWTKQTYPFL